MLLPPPSRPIALLPAALALAVALSPPVQAQRIPSDRIEAAAPEYRLLKPVEVKPAVEDLVIVALGDSFASGEGSPDNRRDRRPMGRTRWDGNSICHRSHSAYPRRVFEHLKEELDGERNVVFESFACSGATIYEGLLGEQSKGPNQETEVMPQIEAAETWMRERGYQRLDAVILSIGINDIRFARAVQRCLMPGPSCIDRVRGQLDTLLDIMPSQYSVLATVLAQRLDPRHVFVVEYPNPTKDASGQYCDRHDDGFTVSLEEEPARTLFGTGIPIELGGKVKFIDATENLMAHMLVLNRLNNRIRDAAAAHRNRGWVMVAGLAEASARHGYCAGTARWFNTLDDSWNVQGDMDGSVHPNHIGHRAFAEIVFEKVVDRLNLRGSG